MSTLDMSDPVQANYFHVCQTKSMLKLAARGMKHSRVSNKQLMGLAEKLTGKKFKPRDYIGAIEALELKKEEILKEVNGG